MPAESRVEQLKSFLSSNPDDTFLNYALATEYVGLGMDEEAEEIFRKLIQTQPQYSPAYYHLGKMMERKGNRNEALKLFEEGVEVCKNNKEVRDLAEMQAALTNLMYDE